MSEKTTYFGFQGLLVKRDEAGHLVVLSESERETVIEHILHALDAYESDGFRFVDVDMSGDLASKAVRFEWSDYGLGAEQRPDHGIIEAVQAYCHPCEWVANSTTEEDAGFALRSHLRDLRHLQTVGDPTVTVTVKTNADPADIAAAISFETFSFGNCPACGRHMQVHGANERRECLRELRRRQQEGEQ